MHTNSYVPIPVYGPDADRRPRRDPGAPVSHRQRRATQAHSNAARERILARNESTRKREAAMLDWQLRAAAKRDAERAADYVPIGEEAGAELRRMVEGV